MTERQAASDAHRPQYHFLPPDKWMNDPNGLIQWDDRYHLFYQYNPEWPYLDVKYWGHAVSTDLVHWKHLPIALVPTPGGPDKDGCWTGCAVNDRGMPTLVYTGVHPEVQCIATSSDGLTTWQKYDGNPVIAKPPADLDVVGFRDPFVWREEAGWYAVIGSGIRGVGGAILLYRSDDLRRWEYLGPALVGTEFETGTMWECPNLFPIGDKFCLIVSAVPLKKVLYFIGSYAGGKFVPQSHGVIDHGGDFYAPQTMQDRKLRRLMWGWVWEGRDEAAQYAAGWAGVMSVPRVLSLGPKDELRIEPAPELELLRGEHKHLERVELGAGARAPISDMAGAAFELIARFRPGPSGRAGIKVRCSPNGAEQTLIAYDQPKQQLLVDRTRSSTYISAHLDVHEAPLSVSHDELVQVHIFVDHSVIEVCGNSTCWLTSRIYPSRADSLGVELLAENDGATFESVEFWPLKSI